MSEDDVGRMTKGLRDNAKDIFDIWMFQPSRHVEFGPREIEDLQSALVGIAQILRGIEKVTRRAAA